MLVRELHLQHRADQVLGDGARGGPTSGLSRVDHRGHHRPHRLARIHRVDGDELTIEILGPHQTDEVSLEPVDDLLPAVVFEAAESHGRPGVAQGLRELDFGGATASRSSTAFRQETASLTELHQDPVDQGAALTSNLRLGGDALLAQRE
ncbi:MAG: hypothetical protein QM658_04715 [Gordonia sp. (in: high G+C Gram-positive bacteria)]